MFHMKIGVMILHIIIIVNMHIFLAQRNTKRTETLNFTLQLRPEYRLQ